MRLPAKTCLGALNTGMLLPALLMLLTASQALHAQNAAPETTIIARDMREEIVRINVTVKDINNRQETRPMPITIFRPAGDGPYPLVVFNHGRPTPDKRALQARFRPEHAARYFVAKGFVVLIPMRVGYWETYGDFDPEQNGPCNDLQVEPMSIAASDQVLATVEYARNLPYADTTRWFVAGVSVGGLAAVATVGRNPKGLLGGINFSGGSGGNPDVRPGRSCSPARISSYWNKLAKEASAPMLWLYWRNDKYWGEEVPRRWHEAWVHGGGKAELKSFPPAGEDGHLGLTEDMNSWLPTVDEFLGQFGFSRPAIVRKPEVSSFAEIGNAAKVPISAQSKVTGYAKFLELRVPRAFAVGERGAWGFASGDYAMGKAIGACQRSGQSCRLYAVDDDVVWPR